MDGLTQSYMFKERLMKFDPIDLDQLRSQLLLWTSGTYEPYNYWAPYSDTHHAMHSIHMEPIAIAQLIINGVPSLQRGL